MLEGPCYLFDMDSISLQEQRLIWYLSVRDSIHVPFQLSTYTKINHIIINHIVLSFIMWRKQTTEAAAPMLNVEFVTFSSLLESRSFRIKNVN